MQWRSCNVCMIAFVAVLVQPHIALAGSGMTVHVPGDFPTIQQAIDAAADGDEIIVAPGVYGEPINYTGKSVILRSTNPFDPVTVASTVLDARKGGKGKKRTSGFIIFESGESAAAVLDGFTIRDAPTNAVGILASGPSIVRCVFSNNSAGVGAAIAIMFGDPLIDECRFTGNEAGFGAGVWSMGGAPVVSNCVFQGNSASYGAGLFGEASIMTVADSIFEENSALGGGAIGNQGSMTISGCTFSENTAELGGAVFNNGIVFVEESMFSGNVASGWHEFSGGGLYSEFGSVEITASTFSRNTGHASGGAVAAIGDFLLVLHDCTFEENTAVGVGGGVYMSSTKDSEVSASAFVQNAASTGGALFVDRDSNPVIAASVFCENKPEAIAGPWTDLGNNEFHESCASPIPGDLNGDGAVNIVDLLAMLGDWGDCAACQNCPADLNDDCTVNVSDLLLLLANWG